MSRMMKLIDRDLLSSFKICLSCGMILNLEIGTGIWISQWGYDGVLVSMFGFSWCIFGTFYNSNEVIVAVICDWYLLCYLVINFCLREVLLYIVVLVQSSFIPLFELFLFKLLTSVPGGGPDGGAQATSYNAVVAHGSNQRGERTEHQQTRAQNNRGGDKGKGIAYEKQGSSKQDGSFHPYKGKLTRGYGDGSSMNGRVSGYGQNRRGMQARGAQPRGVVPRGQHLSTVSEGKQQLPDPSKLMLDAFKGAGKSSGEKAPIGVEAQGSGSHNKACKALLFEESSSVEHDFVPTREGVELGGSLALKMQSEGDDEVQKLDERALHTQALDDANMMLEGELLSDSELLLEEGEELEDWEHGELTDVMEEEVQVVDESEGGGIMLANAGKTDVVDEGTAPLKKGAKVGIGGTSKKRLGPGFVSPPKKLLAKVAAKPGDKGAKRVPIFCRVSLLVLWVLPGQVFSRLCFTTLVNSDARYFSEADNWSGGIIFFGYGGTLWDLWAYAYVICLNNWFLAGDGWCDVMILRCLRWFYFGSKIMSLLIWRKECGVVTLLGSLVRDGVVYAVRVLIVDDHFGTRSWRDVGGVDELNQQGWNVSFFGYMALNGFSALCIWYGFDSKMVSAETSEVEVEFGVMRFILMSVYFCLVVSESIWSDLKKQSPVLSHRGLLSRARYPMYFKALSLLESVDNIAKQASICNKKYVVTWFV
ncbi:LOW QUALITY PROTEIN: hypothetical protein HID58_028816 [Brassica napus]|uniref:Uncharacterized protein n=1 Tax=Brassica napus TaxID=3708 RepID=A0ABQ8CBF1_BRANA|nr:LOW QUALITY PROTEIN: hypothetical protein HID58_028816 [Brassica napus]